MICVALVAGRGSTSGKGTLAYPWEQGYRAGTRISQSLEVAASMLERDGILFLNTAGGAVQALTITGPFDASGVGDTPSRREIFVCRPKIAAEETPCAERILARHSRVTAPSSVRASR